MFEKESRVMTKRQITFENGSVVLPRGSEGTVIISGPNITGVTFDNDSGSVTYRIVSNQDLTHL